MWIPMVAVEKQIFAFKRMDIEGSPALAGALVEWNHILELLSYIFSQNTKWICFVVVLFISDQKELF